MRFRTSLAAVLIGAATLPALAARAQDAASAKAFLESVYQHYQHDGKGVDFTGPRAGAYYHSSLLALVRADIKANRPDIPAIDYDPICGCQDWDGIWDLRIDLTPESAQKIEADLSFSLRDPKYHDKDELRRLEITLLAEESGWRIYDILDQSDPKAIFSMRKLLVDDLANIAKEKKAREGH